ncbi:MAG TPA: preprotein translocase subunit SecA [Actinomycetota bacterium]|nr:preprotein translocase subunit SecA [Actinomycetota bacterium]
MSILTRVLSAGQKRKVKRLLGVADAVNALEPAFEPLTDADLRAKTDEFRKRHADGEELDDLLPEAFAAVREAAKRTIGQRHFDVQLIGGAALHQGRIAEMRTGEGKTLVATLPTYLNALTGNNVHVVTVNDYLARFHAEWMGRIYRFLGMSVGAIQQQMNPQDRRPIYAGDIVYGTNSEFGFDYLRDNMAWTRDDQVQRGHYFAIVDEVDSILIDEARTPLIISGAGEESAKWYYQFASIARKLQKERDYEVDEAKRTISVTEEGVHRVEESLGIENLYDLQQAPLVHYLQAAVKAKELYRRDQEYVLNDGEIVIVDEFTGRLMPSRRWTDGIHQAVEAKEGVRIREEQQTLATITIQNYFRMYEKLAGMTGTALTESQEFDHIYKLEVVEIPTNEPMVRSDKNDLIYKTEDAKFQAVMEDVKERHLKGQPVLIGTVSVEKNERLSRLLERQGIPHQVLNAKQHEKEGMIIAQAGHAGAVTVATNMAGRGVDIILGGNTEFEGKQEALARGLEQETPEFDQFVREWERDHKAQWEPEHKRVVELGGLYVVGTERHEARRIDNQLRGRSGRQGDPGESRFYLSLEDELMRLFAGDRLARIMERLKLPDDVPIEAKLVTKSIERAQTNVEQQNFEMRKNVLKYDDVLNTQRQVIYEQRTKILEGEHFADQAKEMIEDVVLGAVDTFANAQVLPEEWDLAGLIVAIEEVYPTQLRKEHLEGHEYEEVREAVLRDAHAAYEAKEQELGAEGMRRAERLVLLNVLDAAWRDHLYEMDYLREGIGLRAMGQRDPLVEYQREGYELFQSLIGRIREDFTRYIFHVASVDEDGGRTRRTSALRYTAPAKTSEAAAQEKRQAPVVPQPVPAAVPAGAGGGPVQAQGVGDAEEGPMYETVRRDGDKVGRNDPCPCGSGKKYKRCHGAAA